MTTTRGGRATTSRTASRSGSCSDMNLDRKLFEEAGLIGDHDDCDVSWAFEAQSAVVLNDEIYKSFDSLTTSPDEDSDVGWMLPLQAEALELSEDASYEG